MIVFKVRLFLYNVYCIYSLLNKLSNYIVQGSSIFFSFRDNIIFICFKYYNHKNDYKVYR